MELMFLGLYKQMYGGTDFPHLSFLVSSSQEPDLKRQRMDDSASAVANSMTDMQANNSAYNYNWYQVGQSPGC